MIFADIVDEVCDRLNLSADADKTRVGRTVNEFYRALASSVGFSTIQRTTATATTTIANRSLVFGPTPTGVQKILSVFNAAVTPPTVLVERSFDELRNSVGATDPAGRYAIQLMGSSSVTILLDSTPTTQYTLSADVLTNLTSLSGSQVPAFAEDYHNALIYGAMSVELEKQEKYDLAGKQEGKYNTRVAELRYYIAKSAYNDVIQGRRGTNRPVQLV